MPQKPNHLARKVLQEIHTKDGMYESLDGLLEILENKFDPDPKEIYIVSQLYKIIENVKILEGYLHDYIEDEKTHGNKLDEIYNRDRKYGTSKLFEY